LLGTTMIENKS